MNPENDYNHFSAISNVRLSDGEKSRMRALLRAHVAANPPSRTLGYLFFRHAIGTAFAAVLLVVGGTSVFAHRSMPDDFLYPLKLAVSDRISRVGVDDEDAKIGAELSQIARMLHDEEKSAEDAFDDEEHEAEAASEQEKLDHELSDDSIDDELKDLENELDDIFDDKDEGRDNNEDNDNENSKNNSQENRSDRRNEEIRDNGAAELRALEAELQSIGKDLDAAEDDEPEENEGL